MNFRTHADMEAAGIASIGAIEDRTGTRFIWSREAGCEVFGHIADRQGCMVRGSAGFYHTTCPVKAARRAGILSAQGPSLELA